MTTIRRRFLLALSAATLLALSTAAIEAARPASEASGHPSAAKPAAVERPPIVGVAHIGL
jgi:hypothetical protein